MNYHDFSIFYPWGILAATKKHRKTGSIKT